MEQKVEFKKIRDFGEIIGDTFMFIKQNFKPLFKSFLLLCGLFILAGMITSLIAQLQMVSMAEPSYRWGRHSSSPYGFIGAFIGKYLLMMIFMILSYTAIYTAVLSYIAVYISKGNVAATPDEVWAYFKYYFLRMLSSGVVMSLFAVICFVLCFLPGVYVFPAVTLFYPIMILENGTLAYAFSRSFKLVSNHWWPTAGVLFVSWIITYACSAIIQMPAFILTMVGTFTGGARSISKGYVIISSVSSYLSQVFFIIPIIASAFCYFNLLEREESVGLLERIDNFGTGTNHNESIQEEY